MMKEAVHSALHVEAKLRKGFLLLDCPCLEHCVVRFSALDVRCELVVQLLVETRLLEAAPKYHPDWDHRLMVDETQPRFNRAPPDPCSNAK